MQGRSGVEGGEGHICQCRGEVEGGTAVNVRGNDRCCEGSGDEGVSLSM